MSERKYQPTERERAVLRKQVKRRETESPALRVEVLSKGAMLFVDHPDAAVGRERPELPPVRPARRRADDPAVSAHHARPEGVLSVVVRRSAGAALYPPPHPGFDLSPG